MLIVTSGFTLSQHYCGGDIVSVALNPGADACCDMNGCCHTESVWIHFDEDYVTSGSEILKKVQPEFYLIPLLTDQVVPDEPKRSGVTPDNSSPPVPDLNTRLTLLQSMIL